jgi:CheY-like chemotaxis protein
MPLKSFKPQGHFPLILIVDDDPSLRLALKDIFEFSGYAVMTAGSAREGLQALRAAGEKPDLIISDVLMSEMDGYQFYQAVYAEEQWRDIPFVFLSAKSRLRDDVEKMGLKVNMYLSKPFMVEDLLKAVARLVRV